jgi:hypothetical protein
MVNVDQQHILKTQTQYKIDNVRITVTLWHGCLNISEVKQQHVLHILSVCLLPYLYNMQSACSVLCYHVFRIWLHCIFPHYLTKDTIYSKDVI